AHLQAFDLFSSFCIEDHEFAATQVGDEHVLAVRREFQAIGALGSEVERLFDLLSGDIDDGYAAVARVRCPELFFIGRNVDSLWPFPNRNDYFIPTLRPGALNQCDAI